MIIKKGTHSPFRIIRLLRSFKTLKAKVIFTDSCRYDIGSDQSDINKLFGFSFLTWKIFRKKEITIFGKKINIPEFRPMHHYNSYRFGWRYSLSGNNIEIFAYWYDTGERNSKYICSVAINTPVNYELAITNERAIFKMESIDIEVITPNNSKRKSKIGYLLSPYFGGNQTAPYDMEIVFNLL